MSAFETIHTNYGLARIAAAAAGGSIINLQFMAVGDGNGQPVTPNPAQVALVREVYRAAINESLRVRDQSRSTDLSCGDRTTARAVSDSTELGRCGDLGRC